MDLKVLGIEDNAELQSERMQLSEKLKKDASVLAFVEKHNIPVELIDKYPMKFSRLRNQLKLCENCSGLENCGTNNRGFMEVLSFEEPRLKTVIEPCGYKKEERNRENNERNRYPHLRNYRINDCPKDTQGAELSKIDVRSEKDPAYLTAVGEIYKWLQSDRLQGFYLYGKVGVGKTYLAACIANAVAQDNKKVTFIHMPSFLSRLKNAFDDPVEYEALVESCKKCDLLVMDDIGAEPVSPWYRDEILLPILNTRMNERKLTCFTSNLSMEELEYRFSVSNKGERDELAAQRLTDRIRVLSKSLKISGVNRRIAG